jgi:Mechanosensitive ion channel, conserved TM helix
MRAGDVGSTGSQGGSMLAAVEWSQGIQDAWSRVTTFVPKFIGFLIILLIGWFIAKALAKAADRVLERVGFDRAVERGGIARAMANTKYDPSGIISKVIYYALMLIVLQMAFGVFGPNPVSDLLEGVIAYLPKVIAAMLIIVVAFAIAAVVKELVETTLGGLSYGRSLAFAASIAIMVVGVFAALDQLQIAPAIVTGLFYAVLITVSGIAIIAIGGAGIVPMRSRWESTLRRYDEEKQNVRQAGQGATDRIQDRYEQRKDQVKSAATGQQGGGARQTVPDPTTPDMVGQPPRDGR